MASKELRFGDEAWRAIDKGVEKVANAVKITLGPRGRNVVIEKKWGSPTITNDGVTIAKEIDLGIVEDAFIYYLIWLGHEGEWQVMDRFSTLRKIVKAALKERKNWSEEEFDKEYRLIDSL